MPKPQIVTMILIAVNVLVYIFELVPKWDIRRRLAMNTNQVVHDHQWYRVFSSMFVHFGFFHILMNMVALYYIGNLMEPDLAVWEYLIIYLGAGICSSLMVMLKDKIRHTDEISGGASGAIFGLLGALLIMAIQGVEPNISPGLLITDIVIMLIPGFTSKRVSLAGHVGGLLGGILLGLALV